MIYFECDYAEGAHPRILERLQQTNLLQTPGYGTDNFSDQARETIRRLCACPDADVHFLVGGTQTNMIVIGAALRPHQGVIAAESGHISVHESGAIEATGHKVLALPGGREGKLTAAQVEAVVAAHRADKHHEHTVQPAMVYISHPTEFGALYSLRELEVLSAVCRQLGLLLFMDGARLGYALAAEANDLTLPDIARLCDVFYIGGTKVGALFGEAVVISSSSAADCWLRGACLVFNSRHYFRRDCISISVGTLYAWPCVSVRPLKHGRSTSLRRRPPTSNSRS